MSKSLIGGITNRVLMLIAAALLVLSYASAFVNPAKAWYMMLPGLFFFPLALLNLFLLVWAVVRRSGRLFHLLWILYAGGYGCCRTL